MSKVKLITDTASDITKELAKELDVKVIPMAFLVGEREYYEGTDGCISLPSFYKEMKEGKSTSTSQITGETFKEVFEEELKKGNDVIYIGLSSGLSASFERATMIKNQLKIQYPDNKIYLVDSLSASMAESLIVHKAAELLKEGKSAKEVWEHLEVYRKRACSVFTVESLKYLQRGGRVSKTAAVIGTILQIKPILYVNDEGKLIPFSKKIGRKQSIAALINQMVKTADPGYDDVVMISHGDCIKEAEIIGEELKKSFPGIKKVIYNYIGTIIGSHSGPGTLALFYFAKNRDI